MTPSTPIIPIIYALKSKLEDIKAEGVEARYARHARLNKAVRDWGLAKGFKLFPKEGHGSVTLNCFANTLGYDLSALNKILKAKHQLVIDGGYGKLKGDDVPDLEHGRRDRRHDRGPHQGPRQRPRRDAKNRQPEHPSRKTKT
jgi:hypothetical protein